MSWRQFSQHLSDGLNNPVCKLSCKASDELGHIISTAPQDQNTVVQGREDRAAGRHARQDLGLGSECRGLWEVQHSVIPRSTPNRSGPLLKPRFLIGRIRKKGLHRPHTPYSAIAMQVSGEGPEDARREIPALPFRAGLFRFTRDRPTQRRVRKEAPVFFLQVEIVRGSRLQRVYFLVPKVDLQIAHCSISQPLHDRRSEF